MDSQNKSKGKETTNPLTASATEAKPRQKIQRIRFSRLSKFDREIKKNIWWRKI